MQFKKPISSTANKPKQSVRVGNVTQWWSRAVTRLYCTRCAVGYCLWHLLSVKNIWFQYSLLKEQKRQSHIWKGVRVWGVQPGLPNRNTHQSGRCGFIALGELMSCFYLYRKNLTPRKACFFYYVRMEASSVCWCGISCGWNYSCPQKNRREVHPLQSMKGPSAPSDVHQLLYWTISVDVSLLCWFKSSTVHNW